MKRIFCALIAFVMVALMLPLTLSAASFTLKDTGFEYSGVDPVPLLVLVVSYDPDGDGKDAYEEGLSTTDPNLPTYGEQWAHSEESYWSKILFGDDGYTMKNYFKLMSNDKFYFTPAAETYGEANNGIVYVTLKEKHPGNASGSVNPTDISTTRITALNAAAEYVDFKSFDKDGSGGLSWKELSVVYIIAGRSTKFGMADDGISTWRMGSYKQNGTTWHTKINGVRVMKGDDGAKYAVVGEMQSSGSPLSFGSIAHELGHVLGANDLYTYGGYTWCGGPGEIALQGGGSGIGGNKGVKKGVAPSAIDPYYLTWYGFQGVTVAQDGEYTLYSRESEKGEYNIIRVNTNNPKEYYLIENRYTVTPETFDAIDPAERGIQIWHVDEGIMESETLPNCWKGSPHAPGLTPVCSNGVSGRKAWDNTKGNNIFESYNFKFAGSETWYTAMTDEEAENYYVKIEMLDPKGNEMRIKVTGAPKQPTYSKVSMSSPTAGEFKVEAIISQFNGNTVTGGKLTLYSDAAMTNVVGTAEASSDGKRTVYASITGLNEYTKYYYKFETVGSVATEVNTGNGTTSGKPIVKTSYKLLFYTNGAGKRSFGVTVKKGEMFDMAKLPSMNKSGYVFCGWYRDEELTEKYNFNVIEENCVDIPLYPRWEAEDEAVSFVIKNATVAEPIFGFKVGEAIEEIIPDEQEGKTFAGWYKDEALTIPFYFSEEITEGGTITIYAKWNGGSEETTSSSATSGSAETTAEQTSATTAESTSETTGGTGEKSSSAVVIVVVVIVVAAAVAVAAIFIIKKKK